MYGSIYNKGKYGWGTGFGVAGWIWGFVVKGGGGVGSPYTIFLGIYGDIIVGRDGYYFLKVSGIVGEFLINPKEFQYMISYGGGNLVLLMPIIDGNFLFWITTESG